MTATWTDSLGGPEDMVAELMPEQSILTGTERQIFAGLRARDRLIYLEHVAPLQLEFQAFLNVVEDRLGLDAGAIGTTHDINLETLAVSERVEDQ